MDTFGERLRKLRENKELTQIELAKVLSLANSTISQYEANRRSPDSDTLQRLADIFGVTVDYLLCRPSILKEQSSGYHPDVRRLSRAAEKMTPEEAKKSWDVIKAIFPEKFKGE